MVNDPADPPRRPGTPSEDDLPPTGEEASAQRTQAVKPLFWIVGAAVLCVIFVVGLILMHGASPPAPMN